MQKLFCSSRNYARMITDWSWNFIFSGGTCPIHYHLKTVECKTLYDVSKGYAIVINFYCFQADCNANFSFFPRPITLIPLKCHPLSLAFFLSLSLSQNGWPETTTTDKTDPFFLSLSLSLSSARALHFGLGLMRCQFASLLSLSFVLSLSLQTPK